MAIGVSAQPGEADSLKAAKAVCASSSAVAITTIWADSVTLTKVKEIIMQADSTNSVDVLVGDATNQYIHLPAGASLTLVISDLTKVFLKPASGSVATVNC